ncbi:MAG: hydrolase [Marmoricola sp.]|nr:hydrolase [Marmoricola sp.]
MRRYVALGSSFASGPGLGAGAGYPHLVADRLGLDLQDVSRSGATTAHVLRAAQGRRPPQIGALDGSEELVTVTIAGNDVGMSMRTMLAGLPAWARGLPVIRSRVAAAFVPAAYEPALAGVGASLREVTRAIRERSPEARVVVVDYLTVLPPAGVPAPPLSSEHADAFVGSPPGSVRRRRWRPRPRSASSSPRLRPAPTTTPGQRSRGRRGPPGRCRGTRWPSTPTRPGCGPWPTWWSRPWGEGHARRGLVGRSGQCCSHPRAATTRAWVPVSRVGCTTGAK